VIVAKMVAQTLRNRGLSTNWGVWYRIPDSEQAPHEPSFRA
jgi:hypothetical protein